MAESSFLNSISLANNPPTSKLSGGDPVFGRADQAQERFSEDFNNFLNLLTTQLQNQDPTEPLDTNQFTQQLATLSSVEQAIATNQNMEKLLGFLQAGQIGNAVSYIGKGVDAPGDSNKLEGGAANFTYELPSSAEEMTATIVDARGVAVFKTENLPSTAGRHDFNWNGIGNQANSSGIEMPEGVYRIILNAKDSDGEEIKATTYTTGRVVSVESDSQGMTLSLDTGSRVSLEDVKSVRELPPLTAPAADSEG